MKKKICFVTSSRADYGLLKGLINEMSNSPRFEIHLIISGSHLMSEFGSTLEEIESNSNLTIHILKFNTELISRIDQCDSISEIIGEAKKVMVNIEPHALVLLGDRFEMLGFAISSTILGIPIAHIQGGEVTTGSMDDTYRHTISKMSALHFVANSEFRNRLIRMGESPDRIHIVGSLGIDTLASTQFLEKKQLEKLLHTKIESPSMILTYHPDSIHVEDAIRQVEIVIQALENFPAMNIYITGANADIFGLEVNKIFKKFAQNKSKVHFFESLGQLIYHSLIKQVDLVAGNSSSGIIEVPWLGKPTVNIGERQNGRPKSNSILDVPIQVTAISNAIEAVLRVKPIESSVKTEYPYGIPGAKKKIINIISEIDFDDLLPKLFYDSEECVNDASAL